MGWLEAKEENRRQHLQMVATGNIKDIDRINERDRRRKVNLFLWAVLIIFGFLTYSSYRYNIGNFMSYLLVTFIIAIVLAVRQGIHKNIKKKEKSRGKAQNNQWIRINKLPAWAYKKMRAKKVNIVNGNNYIYKREGKRYFKMKR